jgi:hypothetical protein
MNKFFLYLDPAIMLLWTWIWMTIVSFFFYFLGKKHKAHPVTSKSDQISTHMLGLFALILGFSFSIAIGRWEKRLEAAVEEANSISTVYMQTQVQNYPGKEKLRDLIVTFLDERITAYNSEDPIPYLFRLQNIQNEIWTEVKTLTEHDKSAVTSTYMTNVNKMIDIANGRKFTLIRFLPVHFYVLILLLATISIGMINYDLGKTEEKLYWRSAMLIFLFGVILVFIFDLDHSRKGLIRVDQNALTELRESI